MFTTIEPRLLNRQYIRTATLTSDLTARCIAELGSAPVAVRRDVVPTATALRCFWNVAEHVEHHAGSIVFGWSIHEWPHLFWEAQHHAVWRSPDDELVDITPAAAPGSDATLFVEDESAAFDLEPGFGAPEDTRRFPLVDWPELRGYSDAGVNIRIRQHVIDEDRWSSDGTLRNFRKVERDYKEAMMLELANMLGDAAACFCGSERSFALCCRAGFS